MLSSTSLTHAKSGKWVLLELNPRISVEHTVSGPFLFLFSHYLESNVHLILLETDLELLRIRLLLAVSPSTTLASLTIAGASNEVMLSTSISLWPDHTGAQNIAPYGEEEETFAAISLPPVLRTHSEARWQMNWSLQSLASHLYYHAQLTTSSSESNFTTSPTISSAPSTLRAIGAHLTCHYSH